MLPNIFSKIGKTAFGICAAKYSNALGANALYFGKLAMAFHRSVGGRSRLTICVGNCAVAVVVLETCFNVS